MISFNASDAIDLLARLIETPSLSGQEGPAADLVQGVLESKGVRARRMGHNVWACNRNFHAEKPNLLLNSHLDTVPPNQAYTRDPFSAQREGDRLYGLGSNDAGGALVSLLATFLTFYEAENLPINIIFAATAEEENSGPNGLESLLPHLPTPYSAIIGEPTQMNAALAERGLMVLEATTHGVAGHAARSQGQTAIDLAIEDILKLKAFSFSRSSELLGPIKASVNVIQAGRRHNVVPATCRYAIDVRLTDVLPHDRVFEELQAALYAELEVISLRKCPPAIDAEHPLVQAAVRSGAQTYISPTTSDRALIHVPSLKMSPGVSERSHTADEFILVSEIQQGIEQFIDMITFLDETMNG